MLAITGKLDEFRGDSRVTTWAFKFVNRLRGCEQAMEPLHVYVELVRADDLLDNPAGAAQVFTPAWPRSAGVRPLR